MFESLILGVADQEGLDCPSLARSNDCTRSYVDGGVQSAWSVFIEMLKSKQHHFDS